MILELIQELQKEGYPLEEIHKGFQTLMILPIDTVYQRAVASEIPAVRKMCWFTIWLRNGSLPSAEVLESIEFLSKE